MSAKVPQFLLDGLDRSAFEDFASLGHAQHAYKRANDHDLKYTEYERWIARAWKDATLLGLHRQPPIDILDIGTGPGYFPYVCRKLGHRCVGLDRPGFFPFWERLHQWLGLGEIVEHTIKAKKTLSARLGRFDLVTAYRCQFNFNQAEGRLWNVEEWNFFLDDLRDNVLRPGARFAIKLTRQEDKGSGSDGLKRDDPMIIELFARRGARETGKVLVFDPLT